MVFITINLSGITIPINTDLIGIIDILSDLRDKVLELSLKELDEKFGSETWCFISRIQMPDLPRPGLRIFVEVDDFYNYPDLNADVTHTFEKYWAALAKTL